MEMSGQLQGPAALPPRKELPVLIAEDAGRAPESVWTPLGYVGVQLIKLK
jgi:hypothetical protein